jgi:molybdopterin-guanine dinucleotide biosynthesis protein A
VCSELIVVGGADRADPPLPADLPVVMARDARPDEGPLAGLAAGLAAAHGDLAFVVGGDMPDLQSRVLLAMLRRAEADDVDAVALADGARWRPLPLLVRVAPAAAAASRLLGSGRRRLRDLSDALRLAVVDEPDWRALDPAGRTLVDVDEQADLER